MRKNIKGCIPFEFIYSEAESSSEDELAYPNVSHLNKLSAVKNGRISRSASSINNNKDEIYSILSEECVNSDQSVTSDLSYFSVESDSGTVESVRFLESSGSSKIYLERNFQKSPGQDFDESQEAPQSKDNDIFKSLPNRLTANKFSILSTIYDKPCAENEISMEMENSIQQLFCANPGCQEVFACEKDLRNHMLSQYNPANNRNVISQQFKMNMDSERQYNSSIVDKDAIELDSYKRLECNKRISNSQKNDSYDRKRCNQNFLTRNIHRNSLNTARDVSQHGKYFTSESHSNGHNDQNHSEPSEDNNNKHFIFGEQTCEHNLSSENDLKNYLNRFQPVRYDKQKCKDKEFTTGSINSLNSARYICEGKGYDQKFRTKKELKNKETVFRTKEIPLVSYNCKEHRFKQRFRYENGRTIHLIKNHPRICKLYNRRFA
ncbi:hypothetical protein F8M41_019649 [Gigaspora margarita]|uniref:Uncharacterized protein n=1 Tax=Gigaspora margarita TaxID=4874 RepID=A0A8H4AJS9_GIGMA|nr:hypothetical protein F8M41_019649 [Gigaspora margarita]